MSRFLWVYQVWSVLLLNTQVCLSSRNFIHYFLGYTFSMIFFFCFPYGTQMIWILGHFILSLRSLKPLRLCSCFFYIFSLLLELDEFYWFVLSFTDSVLYHLHSTIKSIQWMLCSWIFQLYRSSIISICSFLIIYFQRFPIFICFKGICDWLLDNIHEGFLKILVK